jgi:hypothetical protein
MPSARRRVEASEGPRQLAGKRLWEVQPGSRLDENGAPSGQRSLVPELAPHEDGLADAAEPVQDQTVLMTTSGQPA